jgi:hypothetical protein
VCFTTIFALVLAGIPNVARAKENRPYATLAPAEGAADVDQETKQLKELYERAQIAFVAGRHDEAARMFDEGYKRSELTAFLFNAAVAWERAGRLELAVDRYAEYVIKDSDSPDVQETEERIEALRNAIAGQKKAEVGELRTKGVAIITTKPPGAEVRLDDPRGEVFATTPFQGTLPAGEHVVHVSFAGYKPEHKAIPDSVEKMIIMHFSLSEEYFLGHIEIRSSIEGADVQLVHLTDAEGNAVPRQPDSETSVGKTPFSNQVTPGRYAIRVTKLGFVDYETELDVKQGKVATLNAKLDSVEHVIFRAVPKNPESKDAEVTLVSGGNQAPICTLPCDTTLPPGSHKILVKKDGMKSLRFDIEAAAADLVTVDVTLQPATRRVGAIVTGVLMAGTLATGIVFGVRAKRTRDELQSDVDKHVQVDEDDPRAKIGKRDAIIADAAFGATALLGALTLFYLLRQTGKPSVGRKEQRDLARRARIAPALGPGHLGVAGELRF